MPENSGGLRVLVVDDVDELRILVSRALTARGYRVDLAATLVAARAMDPGGYDAVLVDAHLGAERGIDLVEAMRSADPTAPRRCLVMTGGSVDELPVGVARLTKPFQLSELIDAVRALHQPDAMAAPGQAGIAAGPGAHPTAPMRPAGNRSAAGTPTAGNRSAGTPQAWRLLGLSRRLRARERHELIDFLHDGPIQDLTAISLKLQMMFRAVPPPPGFDAVLQQLDAVAGSLRWLVDGDWPFLKPEIGLTAAIRQRTAWLLTTPATVDTEGPPAALGEGEVPIIVDVVEMMLLEMMPAGPPARAHVALRADEHLIQIELTLTCAAADGQAIGNPATSRAALEGLALALGGSAQAHLDEQRWRASVALRRQPLSTLRQADQNGNSPGPSQSHPC